MPRSQDGRTRAVIAAGGRRRLPCAAAARGDASAAQVGVRFKRENPPGDLGVPTHPSRLAGQRGLSATQNACQMLHFHKAPSLGVVYRPDGGICLYDLSEVAVHRVRQVAGSCAQVAG